MSAMECADVAAFTFFFFYLFITTDITIHYNTYICRYVTNKLYLLCKFISSEATVINLLAILRVFPVGLGK